MNVIPTTIQDLVVIEPQVFNDERGFFYESFNQKKFYDLGIMNHWVQDNVSQSSYAVLRGLHYQVGEYAQAKLVRVIKGKVWDVAVDLRQNSPTYGKWYGVELTGENHKMFYIPRGFAHGFTVLEDDTIFTYKCDNFYCKEAEGSVFWNDDKLKIDWKIPKEQILLSIKDRKSDSFGKHRPLW